MIEFKRILKNKLRTTLAFFAGFAIVTILGYGYVNAVIEPPEQGTSQDVMENREPVKDSPSYVLNKHRDECWTSDEQPKAELPGAAIVQFTSGKTIYTTRHILVDEAFNEALAAIGYGDETSERLDVIALCK